MAEVGAGEKHLLDQHAVGGMLASKRVLHMRQCCSLALEPPGGCYNRAHTLLAAACLPACAAVPCHPPALARRADHLRRALQLQLAQATQQRQHGRSRRVHGAARDVQPADAGRGAQRAGQRVPLQPRQALQVQVPGGGGGAAVVSEPL